MSNVGKYKQIITLGCSLTHQPGWAAYLEHCTNLPVINLAQSSGSNQLQQRRIQEYIFENGLDDSSIVIWQITGTHRRYRRSKLTDALYKQSEKSMEFPRVVTSSPNIFDSEMRVDYLSHNINAFVVEDENQVLEDLLFYLISIKKFTPNLLVFLGWKNELIMQHIDTFKEHLKKHNIDYIDEPVTDWCLEQNLPFEPMKHPTNGSYCQYAKHVLIPRLEKLLGISIPIARIYAK